VLVGAGEPEIWAVSGCSGGSCGPVAALADAGVEGRPLATVTAGCGPHSFVPQPEGARRSWLLVDARHEHQEVTRCGQPLSPPAGAQAPRAQDQLGVPCLDHAQ
jgi:hypothetical protein